MKLLKTIIDFILFRISFKLETILTKQDVKDLLSKRFHNDTSFVEAQFDGYNFAFFHVNIWPRTYNYSYIIFEGEIIENLKTTIIIKVRVLFVLTIVYFLAFLSIFIGYFIIKANNDALVDVNQLRFSFIPLIIPYIGYFYKIIEVRGILKFMIKRKEKEKIK